VSVIKLVSYWYPTQTSIEKMGLTESKSAVVWKESEHGANLSSTVLEDSNNKRESHSHKYDCGQRREVWGVLFDSFAVVLVASNQQ